MPHNVLGRLAAFMEGTNSCGHEAIPPGTPPHQPMQDPTQDLCSPHTRDNSRFPPVCQHTDFTLAEAQRHHWDPTRLLSQCPATNCKLDVDVLLYNNN